MSKGSSALLETETALLNGLLELGAPENFLAATAHFPLYRRAEQDQHQHHL